MDKNFIPYEIAEEMKAMGYDEPCLAMYSDGVLEMWLQDQYDFRSEGEEDGFQFKNSMWDDSRFVAAPLYGQVFDWFLNEYNLFAETTLWGDGIGYMTTIKEIRQENFREVYNLGSATPNRGLPNWDRDLENLASAKRLIEIAKNKISSEHDGWRVISNYAEKEDFLLSVNKTKPDLVDDIPGHYREVYHTGKGTYDVTWNGSTSVPVVRKFIG